MTTGFIEYLESIKHPVFSHIKKYLPDKHPKGHYDIVRDYPYRQGKYFRPGVLLLAGKLFGASPKKTLPLAAVMQTAEDWLLIHDDVEDHASERRSTKAQARLSLNRLHGDEIAINAGDALHVLMWKMLGDAIGGFRPALGRQIYQKFTEILLTTIEGQFLELSWRSSSLTPLRLARCLEILKKKTAMYTVVGPLQLGAMSAGVVAPRRLQALKEWGEPLGIAFQIWDDIADVVSAPARLGKGKFNDLQESKPTLIICDLFAKAAPEELLNLKIILRKPCGTKTQSEINYVLSLIGKYGIIGRVQKIAARFSREALEKFDKAFPARASGVARDLLYKAAKFAGAGPGDAS